jgi:hypothetical protein
MIQFFLRIGHIAIMGAFCAVELTEIKDLEKWLRPIFGLK